MALVDDREAPRDIPTTNALDGIEDAVQGVLIEAAFVTFSGTSSGTLDNPPELDDERTYIVRASCKEVKRAIRKDKEERATVVMDIKWLYEQGRVPVAGDSNQQPLFDETGEPYEAADQGAGDGTEDQEPDDDGPDVDGEDNVVRPNFSDGGE
jgi:hypothetical protein